MQKKQSAFIIILTIAVVLTLVVFVSYTIKSVNENVTASCFKNLVDTSKELADDLYRYSVMDKTVLSAMSSLISGAHDAQNNDLCEIMKSFNTDSSYISYVELLLPDNTMLMADGTLRDVSSTFNFDTEAGKGAYISGISQSSLDESASVVRNAVPVVRDGKTIYMLYGVIRLYELSEKYSTDIYNGHAYVYIVDGDTGDFLLDTWHRLPGNVSDFSKRQALPGYSTDITEYNLKKGIAGDMAFVSKTTGGILYMHYEPVGINNWSVMITVEKLYAMQESERISASLYAMAGVVGSVSILYMICVLFLLFRAYRKMQKIGLQDKITGLKNRNAYDDYISEKQNKTFASIACVYVDANGLHEVNNKFGHLVGDQMLCIIADALKEAFDGFDVYRIGGDEFVVFCENETMTSCTERIKKAKASVEEHDYYIAYGISVLSNEIGVTRVTQEADEKMLTNKEYFYETHNREHGRK